MSTDHRPTLVDQESNQPLSMNLATTENPQVSNQNTHTPIAWLSPIACNGQQDNMQNDCVLLNQD
jgi:hypothetical protein